VKTHELANSLMILARLLKAGPDTELSEMKFVDFKSFRSSQEIAVNLGTLIALSNIDKSRWTEFIQEYQFPIEIRARDGSRDVLGKLFSYLEENPDAQERIKSSAAKGSGKASPELMKALNTLLKGTLHEPPASRD
jgi:hypothetical protein